MRLIKFSSKTKCILFDIVFITIYLNFNRSLDYFVLFFFSKKLIIFVEYIKNYIDICSSVGIIKKVENVNNSRLIVLISISHTMPPSTYYLLSTYYKTMDKISNCHTQNTGI